MSRIAAYIRFSTSGQAREESFESLLFQVRKAVEQIGGKFEDCKVFRDVMSGRRTDRPGFQELLALIRAKAVDIVVLTLPVLKERGFLAVLGYPASIPDSATSNKLSCLDIGFPA